MGEDNRGSSESSTVLIVVAILGGILLVGCLGGVAVVGGLFWVRTEAIYQPPAVQMSVPPVQATPRIVDEVAPPPPPAPLPPATAPSEEGKPEPAPLVVPPDEKQE
jgi:hypothetical protein